MEPVVLNPATTTTKVEVVPETLYPTVVVEVVVVDVHVCSVPAKHARPIAHETISISDLLQCYRGAPLSCLARDRSARSDRSCRQGHLCCEGRFLGGAVPNLLAHQTA